MSLSSLPRADVPPPAGPPLHQQSLEVARSKTRCAVDALQRALSVLIGVEVSEHETQYALDQLYKAGAYIAQGSFVLDLLRKSFQPACEHEWHDYTAITGQMSQQCAKCGAVKGGA